MLELARYGDPALRRPSEPVKDFGQELQELIAQMEDTMREAHGLGLAAPQVGISLRVAVFDAGDGLVVLANPKIIRSAGERREVEGCLSMPRLYGEVPRPKRVTVRAQDRDGRRFTISGSDLVSTVISHECDHLEGRLFIDRVDPDTLHWLVTDSSGETYRQPTTLEQAIQAFELSKQMTGKG